jgi:hypothetical protein
MAAEEEALLSQKENIIKALDAINKAEIADKRKTTMAMLSNVTDFKKFGADIASALGPVAGVLKGGNTSLTITTKQPAVERFDVRVMAGLNAPAWFQGMVESIIAECVKVMKGERIPLAITALP